MQHAAIRLFAVFAILTCVTGLGARRSQAQSAGVLSELDADAGRQFNSFRFRSAPSPQEVRPNSTRFALRRGVFDRIQDDGMQGDGPAPEDIFSPPPVIRPPLGEELPGILVLPETKDGGKSVLEIVDSEEVIGDSWFPTVGSEGWLRSGGYYLHQDFVMLTRSHSRAYALSVTNDNNSVPSVLAREVFLSTDTGSFRFEPGARITFGMMIGRDEKNRDHSLEFTFLAANEFLTSAAVSNPSGLALVTTLDPNVNISKLFAIPNPPGVVIPGFVGTSHVYSYSSDLRSFEVNAKIQDRLGRDQIVYTPDGRWTRHATSRRNWSLLAGMRYVNYDEAFLFASTDALTGNNGSLDIESQNDLLGLQVGVEWTEQHESWSWGLRGKLGSFINFADQQTVLMTTPDDAIERSRSAADEQLTMLAEFGMIARYQLRPNLALRASYDFIWLQGVALAPEQATFSAAAPEVVNVGGNILFQGGSVGFEFTW